ncbi:MAG: glycoside hydrolase [Chloroflexus sp.]
MFITRITWLILLTICIIAFLAGLLPLPSQAQEGAAFVLETFPEATIAKYPQVAVDANGVYITAIDGITDTNDGLVKLWRKAEEDGAFPTPLTLGTVGKGIKEDWVQTAVTTAPTGEVYVLWIDQAAKTIKFRRREPGGAWHPATFEIMRGHTFAVEPALAVRTNGQIVAAWRDDKAINFAYSNDRGTTWSAVGTVPGSQAYKSQTALAAGPNGELVVTYTRDNPRPLHIMAALWTGTGFSTPVDVTAGSSRPFADASVSFSPDPAPNTRIVVAYRDVDNGIFFAEKLVSNFNDPWPSTLLILGKGDGRVSADYDQRGNLHITWIRTGVSRSDNRLFYTVRPAGQGFLPVVSAPPDSARIFNAWSDARVGARPYMHVVHEYFSGDKPIPRYVLFRAPGTGFGSRPVIEDDAVVVGGDGKLSLNVTFPDLSPTSLPNQVRWRWGAPPTDTESDSGGWQPFTPTGPTSILSVPIPASLRTDAGCVDRTLYTQLRNTDTGLVDQVRSDTVIIDLGVAGNVVVANPFSRFKATPFTSIVLTDLISEGGASDGHPNYTRLPAVFVEIRSIGDCSGLRNFVLTSSSALLSSASSLTISGGYFANVLSPSTTAEGLMPVVVRIRDGLGNFMQVERAMIYDATPPILNGGSLQVQPIANGPSIIVSLQFADLAVTDNLYPGRGFWGVWLANSRALLPDPATNPNLVWIPVEAPGNGNSFTITWSLASGLPENQLTPGTYYVYARVLDGAGNPSAAVLPVATISLEQVTFPQMYLPITSR